MSELLDVYPADACVTLVRDNGERLQIKPNVPRRWIYDGVPTWFIKAMKKVYPNNERWARADIFPGGDGEVAVMLLLNGHWQGTPHDWLDHCGWTGRGEDAKLISEPYYPHAEDIADLQNFCSRAGLDFVILGRSAHYPGATVRIEIREKKIY